MDSILFRKLQTGKLNRKDLKFLNHEISGYRLTALQNSGFIRQFCNWQANTIEKKLKENNYD